MGWTGQGTQPQGWKKRLLLYYFLCKFRFFEPYGCIQKLKTLIIIKVGLRQKAFSALIPCHVAMVTSYFFLGCLEQGGSSHWQMETQKEVGSFLPRQHTPLTGLCLHGAGEWEHLCDYKALLCCILSYLFPAYLGVFQSTGLSLILYHSLEPHNRLAG